MKPDRDISLDQALTHLVDALFDDIKALTDEESMAEFYAAGGDPTISATEMCKIFKEVLKLLSSQKTVR